MIGCLLLLLKRCTCYKLRVRRYIRRVTLSYTMPKTQTERTYYNQVRKQGSSLVVSIPPQIAEHLDLEKGDELGFQKEHSEEVAGERDNGNYASKWNETKQRGDK